METVINIVIASVIFFDVSMGFFVLSQNTKSKSNRIFFLISITAALWAFTHLMLNESTSVIWLESAYAIGSLLILLGIKWVCEITKYNPRRWFDRIIYLLTLSFFMLSFLPGFILDSDGNLSLGAIFIENRGWGLTIYTIYYLFASTFMIYMILRQISLSRSAEEKRQMIYVLSGMFSSLLITALSSFILPHLSIFLFNGIDSIGFLLFLLCITFAITKYKLLNINVLTIQIIIYMLWNFIFIHLLISTENTTSATLKSLLILFISMAIGAVVIKLVRHSKMQDKKIDELNKEISELYLKIKLLQE